MGRPLRCALTSFVLMLGLGLAYGQDEVKPDKPVPGAINRDNVNVRVGAGTQYGIIDKLLRDEKVVVIRKVTVPDADGQQSWYEVTPPTGNYYISNDLLEFDNVGGALVSGAGVFVRRGPGVAFDMAGKLDKGTRLTVLDKGETWSRVRPAAAVKTYVHADMIDVADPEAFKLARVEPKDPDPKDPEPKDPEPRQAGPKEVAVPEGRKLEGKTFDEKLASYDDQLKAELDKPLMERDLLAIAQSLEYLDAAYELNFNQKTQLQRRAEVMKVYVQDYLAKKAIYEEYLTQQRKIWKEAAEKNAEIDGGGKAEEVFDVKGIIQPWGLSRIMPGVTHKLVSDDGNETTLMLLTGDGVDLVKYVDRRVGLKIERTGRLAYDQPIVKVKSAKVLAISTPE